MYDFAALEIARQRIDEARRAADRAVLARTARRFRRRRDAE